MPSYFDSYQNTLSFNEYLIKTTVDYWTAVTFPAIYFAKYL